MKLNKVTITGADDATNIDDILKISKQHPFVEWGILISSSRTGEKRYPSHTWINQLLDQNLNLSCHICGSWVKQICKGFWDEIPEFISSFKRIQLNFSPYLVLIEDTPFVESLKDKHYIFQIKKPTDYIQALRKLALNKNKQASFLYDTSGGRGLYDKNWPNPIDYCGYAGGLEPDLLENQLNEIESVVKDNTIWIDVESKVRTDEVLDLEKVTKFLEVSSKWIEE